MLIVGAMIIVRDIREAALSFELGAVFLCLKKGLPLRFDLAIFLKLNGCGETRTEHFKILI